MRLVEDTDLSETFFVGMVSCDNVKDDAIEDNVRHLEN